ncbi:fungal-specific transcription factor domain-containing protein [Mycena floridula]|nr:fungal-specific transcription factor domain-containing protein [Mycena floridula]
MEWHESDQSEDENNNESQAARKRSSRACDQCRKTKSKCSRGSSEQDQCKSCQTAGTACTFLGPSYKRGPPKGYIHAIEQRWHQVESLLGAIMLCQEPRVQSIVSDLRQDDLAREILARVDMGPYGPSGRRHHPAVGATKEDFFASVLRSNESSVSAPGPPRDPTRSRRQSRVSREKVSTQDRGLSVVPSAEWQDSLSQRLASSSGASSSSATFDTMGAPVSQRRRLMHDTSTPDWNRMYTMESEEDHDLPEALGSLSLDENQEIRFHGQASGLHLISNNDRTDNRHEGGIWSLPMARVWPPSKEHHAIHSFHEEDFEVQLPPIHVQDKLIDLYFTYIHPAFPVIHKCRFLADYQARKTRSASPTAASQTSSSPRPEPSQKISAMLLFSIFALAARFSNDELPFPSPGRMWEAGWDYAARARNILTQIFQHSRPSTVQSLLLMGYRDFGIGSMEQAWIYIGSAMRMAIDLGLNCNSDNWKVHGHALFSAQETQIRRQIWWACMIADRYGSIYMGRPITIRDDDFDTPLPEPDETDDLPWQPLHSDSINVIYPPTPAKIIATLTEVGKLAVIVGAVISQVYPVRPIPGQSRREVLVTLEAQLDQWYLNLPRTLQYDVASQRNLPPPHILFLHIRYWGSVLLLHRAFIPNWKGTDATPRSSTIELKSFDLAQSAASHVSAIATALRENFTLKRCSPFLTSYMLSAGIMHIVTLTLRPSNVQASLGLRQCMVALKDMAVVWPSASRAWDLLSGVKIGVDDGHTYPPNTAERHKRDADHAFGQDEYLRRDSYGVPRAARQLPGHGDSGVQDLSSRIMANMLGLEVGGLEPLQFLPGWPQRSVPTSSHHHHQQQSQHSHYNSNQMPLWNSWNNEDRRENVEMSNGHGIGQPNFSQWEYTGI